MLNEEFVPVSEYAKAIGLTPQRVRQLIMEKKIQAKQSDGRWLVRLNQDDHRYRIEAEKAAPKIRRRGKDARILTFFSHAGGIGKTTLSRDVGYTLATQGYRVLLIDADPQANLTTWLGLERVDNARTLARLIDDDELPEPVRGLFDMPLDLIPANLNLSLKDLEISRIPNGDMLLRRALRDISGYDAVLIDSPPSISKITQMAGLAGEGFVVPVETTSKGIEALQGVAQLAKVFARLMETRVTDWIKLIVPTKFDARTLVDNTVLDQLQAMRSQGFRVSPPVSNRPGAYNAAAAQRMPVPRLRPRSEATAEIHAVTEMLVDILKRDADAETTIEETAK